MARMKSRDWFPPGEWQMIHPEAGQTKPWKGSFSEIVQQELAFRHRNPTLVAKNNLSLHPDDVANEVDSYNAARMIAGGYFGFVILDSDSPPPDPNDQGRLGSAGAVAAGARLLIDWLGSNQKPVPIEIAEARAVICADCPQNGKGDWTRYLTRPAAATARHLLGVKHDMDLRTSLDSRLGFCEACACPLPLKVFVPLRHALSYLTPEAKARLDPRCWMLRVDNNPSG